MHDAITVGIPVLAIFFGVLWNQRGLDKLAGRMDEFGARMESRFIHLESRIDRIQADLLQFYRILGEHGARIENLGKR